MVATGKTIQAEERTWFQRWSLRALYLGMFIGVCQYLNSINVSVVYAQMVLTQWLVRVHGKGARAAADPHRTASTTSPPRN